jgi:PAS domain S-box-containing protein
VQFQRTGQGDFDFVRAPIVRVCGVLTALVGIAALVGWGLHLPVLTTFGTDLLPVAPSTAVLLVLSGLAIAGDPTGSGPNALRRAGAAAWGIVGTVAVVLLGAAAMALQIEAEHPGIPPADDPQGLSLGHMVPVTAISFILLAAAFLLPARASAPPRAVWRRKAASIAGWGVAAFGLVLLVAFTYGLLVAVSGQILPPAIGTAIGFVLLGTGLGLRADPGHGTGGKPAPRRPGVPGASAITMVFAVLALGIVAAGFGFYRGAERRYRADVERQLDFEASLKAEALERWRGDLLADVESLGTNPAFTSLFAEHPASFGVPRTSIVRREGDIAHVLERDETAGPGEVPGLRLPFASSSAVEARGARGEQGVVTGFDARGTQVLAALRPVRGSPWVLVVRAPLSDVFAASRVRLWETVLVVLLFVAGAGAGVSVLWRREEASHLRDVLASEERLRKAFETIPDAVTLTGADDGVLVAANDGFRRISGWTETEAVGKSVAELGFWKDPGERQRFLAEIGRMGLVENFETSFVTRSGEPVIALVSASFVKVGGRTHILAIARDISDRKRVEEAIRESERELREAQAIAGFGSYVLDVGAGRFRTSETVDAIFGISPDWDRSVAAWWALVHPEDRKAMMSYVAEEVIGKGSRFDREYRIVRPKGGEVRWVHGLGEVFLGRDGKATNVRGTIVDVTERRIAAERIREMNQELERRVAERTAQLTDAVREAESFAYTIAHDLKSPLRAIDGYAALLEKDHGARLDGEGRDYLGKVRRGAVTMGLLIADLLEYSKLSRREMRTDSVDVDAVVRAVVASRDEEIQSTGAAVRVVSGGARAAVDPAGLEMALVNLLDNALKFHRPGKPADVTITTSCAGRHALVAVRDEGIGFDMRYHDRIFEIFQHLERSEDYPGTGVGLALVRRAMQRMGGSVRAESAPGTGATFTMELPT